MASNKHADALYAQMESYRATIFTSLPATVISYDHTTQTCSAAPTVCLNNDSTEEGEMLPFPAINGVPVYFPSGGGAYMTFPVKPGDPCLLVFSMLPLDEWVNGNAQANVGVDGGRTHDLTDAIAFIGIGTRNNNSKPDPDHVQIKYGSTVLTIKSDGNAILDGNLRVNGHAEIRDYLKTESDLIVLGKGDISANLSAKDIVADNGSGISLKTHVHHYYWTDGSGQDVTATGQ